MEGERPKRAASGNVTNQDPKARKPQSNGAPAVDEQEHGGPGRGNPFARTFAPHPLVWREARKLSTNKNVRVEDLALCASQDPVIVIELLKTANAMYFSGGRPPITTVTTAIIRLGSDVVLQTLESLLERTPIEDSEVHRLFELQRNRCKRSAIIARMLSEIVSKSLADECQTAGLLIFVGEMLAVAHFGAIYAKLHEDNSPAGLNYKLSQDYRFDVEKSGVTYLQRLGIPELITCALEREGRTRNAERALMKPICFASAEIIDAFDTNRWEKLAPGKQLPPRSSLRLLGIPDGQYLRLYERASEYLFHEKLAQDKVKLSDLQVDLKTQVDAEKEALANSAVEGITQATTDLDDTLQAEIQLLLQGSDEEQPEGEPAPQPSKTKAQPQRTSEPNSAIQEKFSLDKTKTANTVKARKENTRQVVAPPPLRTSAGNDFVNSVNKFLASAKSGEDLLRDILGILTETGPFEKSALIVVSKDRGSAIVVAARGPNISNGQTLILEDPLSPLAQCFSKVQSFGNKSSSESPWGSRAFALAPVDADHDTPVALYADCGTQGALTFEARRMFRAVVDILNQKLPTIPGGIPVEL